MRAVDLAVYADSLAAEASALSARLERARARVRRAAIEREARRSLGREAAARLERLRLVGGTDGRALHREIAELTADLEALEELQAWIEGRLFAAREEEPAIGG